MMTFAVTCLPDHPVCAYAAAELQRHLALLPLRPQGTVTLQVCPELTAHGLAAPQTAEDDQYAFDLGPAGGVIRGANPRSVLLGVYAYLRAIGFCFARPGADGTAVPPLTDPEQLTARDACAAFVRHRGVCIEGANSLENILDFIDWLPKVGYNSFFMQFKTPYVFLQRWYHHTLNPLRAPEPLSEEFLADADRQITQAMECRGLLHHRVGHGWTTDAMGLTHQGGWYQSDEPAPAALQPLLAQVNGKRDFFGGVPTNTNLCYANPQARRQFVDAIADYAARHREVSLLHVWLADLYNNVCECEECARTTLSDQYLELMNQLDEELTARGISTRIVFLLYQELLHAPLHARLKNPDRFVLMFAPISRTFRQSYPHQFDPAPLPPYVRNRFELPTCIEENLTCLRSWQTTFTGDSFVYDYPLGRAHYGDWGYMNIARVIADDVRALPHLGLNGYISCQELRVLCPSALPNYVMGRMLLDARADFDSLCSEYFTALYGAEGPAVRRYLQAISDCCNCDYFNGKGARVDPAYARKLAELEQILQQFILPPAKRSADPRDHFWHLLAHHNRYTTLLAQAVRLLCQGQTDEANRAFARFRECICAAEEAWQPDLDVYRITEVALHYTGFCPDVPVSGAAVFQ